MDCNFSLGENFMHALGVTLEAGELKIALLMKKRERFEIQWVETFDASSVNPFYISKNPMVVSGLNSDEVIFRKKVFNLASEEKILSVLPFEMEESLPFPPEESIISPSFKKISKNATEVNLFASKREFIENHIKKLETLSLSPDIVSSTPAALWRATSSLFPEHTCILSINIGWDQLCCVSILEDVLISSHFIPVGVKDFTEKDFEQKKVELLQHLDRIITFIQQKMKIANDIELFLCGEVDRQVDFHAMIGNAFKQFSLLKEEHATNLPFSLVQKYAVNFGLALEGLYQDEQTTQFRSGSLLSPAYTSSWKKAMRLYAYAGLILSALVFAGGHLLLAKKQKELIKPLSRYLSLAENDKGIFDQQYLIEKITALEKKIAKQKNAFEYFPTVPTPYECLIWLSKHAILSKTPSDLFNIRTLDYSLERYPKIGSSPTAYKAKFEMEFACASPQLAKQFHESLKSDAIIDQKGKVSWNAKNQTYQVSFYLKEL
jgi:hypothetical protein